MNKSIITTVIIFICILIPLTSCTQQENSTPEKNSKPIYPIITEVNSELIEIMYRVDLIPYFQKQIEEKKLAEEQQKKSSSNTKSGQSEDKESFKPKPITINDILLINSLEKETTSTIQKIKEQEIPDDIIILWNEIINNIDNLHSMWDNLQPLLLKLDNSKKAVTGFDNKLNDLTISATNYNYRKTLLNANTLTLYIPQFIENTKNKDTASIFYIKYYVRQIVLDMANNNYENLNKNLAGIKKYEERLINRLMEKNSSDLVEKIQSSIANLENAISTGNINVVKVKAAIVTNNINSARQKLLMK